MVRAKMTTAAAVASTCLGTGLLAASLGCAHTSAALAQEDWKPFTDILKSRPSRAAVQPDPVKVPPLQPMGGVYERGPDGMPAGAGLPPVGGPGAGEAGLRSSLPMAAPPAERATAVEFSDLPPVAGAEAAGQPSAAWRGLDAADFEQLIAGLELPPRSPTLHGLWKRLITADAGVPPVDENGRRFLAVRAEALHRSGLVADEIRLLESAGADNVLIVALLARAKIGQGSIGQGDQEAGCELIKSAVTQKATLPAPLRTELMLLTGYCAASARNTAAAGLAADLLREDGAEASFGLTLLDAIAAGGKPKLVLPKQVSLTDYRLLELAGGADATQLIERAAPAVLAVLSLGSEGDPRLRVLAAEAAARLNVIGTEQLAQAWRAPTFQSQEIADPASAKVDPALRRALLFRAAETERTPFKKTRVIRALLDDARRAGLYLPALGLMARQVDSIVPAAEISWFAETAVEAQLTAGAFDRARTWIDFAAANPGPGGGNGLQHWLALADIADSRQTGPRGTSLGSVEALALRGRYSADLLHRLATVLDALDYNVPIPLWEAASRSPQPTTGHLPATGVLPQLQDAARKAEFGRTVLLSMQALGPAGGEGAHMIALGDAIRALKRARLEGDARQLAFEALFAGWPRSAAN